MIMLISIYVFLISMGLFLNYLQKKSYFFHNEKDIINIKYIAVYLLSYVLHVYRYSIPNIETLPQIRSLTEA